MDLEIHRIEPKTLYPTPENDHLNPSIVLYKNKILMAYRVSYKNSVIAYCELDTKLNPGPSTILEVPGKTNPEDPRLFFYHNQLHCAYAAKRDKWAGQFLLTLTEDFKVESNWELTYLQGGKREKNWQFFQWENDLYTVYRICPHQILKLQPPNLPRYPVSERVAESHSETIWVPNWTSGGHLRGGTPPILANGEYYSFFHSTIEKPSFKERQYAMGCYTFQSKPPFIPLRMTPKPLILPNREERPKRVPYVVFPAGAIHFPDYWLVSYGYYDQWSQLAKINNQDLEEALKPMDKF